jgi:hypothetical protein
MAERLMARMRKIGNGANHQWQIVNGKSSMANRQWQIISNQK